MPASLTNHGLHTLRHILVNDCYCKQMDVELDDVAHKVNYVVQ